MRMLALADLNADADFSTEKFALADADLSTVVQIWLRISAQFCGFGWDSMKLCIILQVFVYFIIILWKWMLISAQFCGFECGFNSCADLDADFGTGMRIETMWMSAFGCKCGCKCELPQGLIQFGTLRN